MNKKRMDKLKQSQIQTISNNNFIKNEQTKIIQVKSRIKEINKNNDDNNNNNNNNKSSVKQWFIKSFKEFCSSTALHGYNYIIREDSAPWERILWIILIAIATGLFFILLWFGWVWNVDTQTVTVIESTHYASWNMPFPAVTICNINKISSVAAQQMAEVMKRPLNVTANDLSQMFRYILHFEGLGNGTTTDYEKIHDILEMNNVTVPEVLKKIAPSCNDMIKRCMWKGTQTRCDTLFQTIFSTKGLCCSFNYYALDADKFPTKMYKNVPKTPRKVTACGFHTGLSVLIKPHVSDYHTTFLNSYGFRVYIHNAYDYPDENAETKIVSSRLESFLSVSPESTYCTSAVRHLPPLKRFCYFEDEIKLASMQKYSFVNCMIECRTKVIYKLCGCVPYHLPTNGSLPVCSMAKLPCVKENAYLYNGALPGQRFNENLVNTDTVYRNCDCLPDCQLIQYPSEITSGNLNRDKSFNSISFFKDINLLDETLMHVFFSDLVSTHYRKDLYQNSLDVLASIGGLLGLFLGFSFVNGFELIYFFTLRTFFDRFIKKNH